MADSNPVSLPPTMRSLVAPRYCKPDEYEVIELPTPKADDLNGDGVLIRVHAAAMQTGDTQIAAGMARLFGAMP